MESNKGKKVNIFCTIGPVSDNPETLKGLADAGMNVARCNFSHGTHEEHGRKFALVREMNKKYGTDVKIMLDTKGPDIRLGDFENGEITVKEGDLFSLYADGRIGNQKGISVTHKDLYKYVKKGDRIDFCSGLVVGFVEEVKPANQEIVVKITIGGKLANHKCLFVPGVDVHLPFLQQADIEDLEYGVAQKVDLIAASFVNRPEDVLAIKKIVGNIPVIAKIENDIGINNLDEIIKVADGLMVARGGMGDNFPIEKLPALQKMMIKKCNKANKYVIVATEMMLNMMQKPRPSRAEVSDIANAIYDGADAVMTSEETAVGDYPVQAIKHMRRIADETLSEINKK